MKARVATVLAVACIALGVVTIVAAAYATAALVLTALRVLGGLS